jgi:hypothetical protein
MSIDRFPIGLEMDVSYPTFQVSLTLLSGIRPLKAALPSEAGC